MDDPGGRSPEHALRVDRTRTAFRRVGDESVVLDLGRSHYFGLNQSAGALWERLISGATYDELLEVLRIAGADDATGDLDRFLAALRREDLVHDVRT